MAATTTAHPASTGRPELSMFRINLMRGGYALMAIGLPLVKWPLLGQAASLPVYEGVTLALLVAMSFLAMLGLRYPVKMLPILLFETVWKVLWLGVVALPHLIADDMSEAMTKILVSFFPEVVIIAVTPWRYVWRTFVKARGEAWR